VGFQFGRSKIVIWNEYPHLGYC